MNRIQKIFQSMATAKSVWDNVFLKNMPLGDNAEQVLNNPYAKSDMVYICIGLHKTIHSG